MYWLAKLFYESFVGPEFELCPSLSFVNVLADTGRDYIIVLLRQSA